MADIKNVLYEEIRRLARKEVKLAVAPLQAKIVELRKTISALSKKVKCAPSAPSAEVSKDSDENTTTYISDFHNDRSVRLCDRPSFTPGIENFRKHPPVFR